MLRRTLADEAIAKHWPHSVRVSSAIGGFYLWATTPRELRARALLDVAERLGASFLFGEAFFADSGGDHHFRLALTAVTRKQIGEGIRRIGEAMATLRAIKPLLEWYARHGRTTLPWRVVRNPYFTLVSEFMLQQTQVDRVVPKFEAFVARFPDIPALARASSGEVLREWQGLGYNMRALRLHESAGVVVERFNGVMPAQSHLLRQLPGVGPYTAAAIRAFGFDLDDAPLDVNIRRIVHRLFYGLEHPAQATTRELDARAQEMVAPGMAHDWNSALMDLGATICTARAPKCLICPLRERVCRSPDRRERVGRCAARACQTARHPKTPFRGTQTTRFARGRIVERLRALPPGRRISLLDLHGDLQPLMPERSLEDVRNLVAILERDGLIACDGDAIALRD